MIPVLPPKHLRREGGCLNYEEHLELGWKIFSLGLPNIYPPLASEEEEEENEMADLVHNFGARKRKWGARFKQAVDAIPEVVGEDDQHPTSKGSSVQEIVLPNSLEMGFHGQSASKAPPSVDLGDVPLTHEEVQEGIDELKTH